MSAINSPHTLVARYLKANNYTETLDTFLREANLSSDFVAVPSKSDITIEKILEEKRSFDLSQQFERLGTDDADDKKWSEDAPALPETITTLPSKANQLFVSAESFPDPENRSRNYVIATTADKRLNMLDLPRLSLDASLTNLHDSPILSCAVLAGQYLLSTAMSGQMILSNSAGKVLDKRQDHAKYAVHVCICHVEQHVWVATAGWDGKIHLYRLAASVTLTSEPSVNPPVDTIILPSNPEALAWIIHPETKKPVLVYTRRDSTFLYYHAIIDDNQTRPVGRQNLAPLSNAWVAFTPAAISLCPTDPTLLAVATSSVPHMKVLLVRLLLPPMTTQDTAPEDGGTVGPAATTLSTASISPAAWQARKDLARQDREAAAIQIQSNVQAPQTAWSTPAVTWRPDGTGVWVNGDDGVVRGVEACSGKVVSWLKNGHEAGFKVRCLCAGIVEDDDGVKREWLFSGGFDQRLVVWRPEGITLH